MLFLIFAYWIMPQQYFNICPHLLCKKCTLLIFQHLTVFYAYMHTI